MIRLMTLMRRNPDVELAEFHERLRVEVGPAVAGLQSVLGIRRYVQTLRFEALPPRPNDALRGRMEEPYDAVAEFWFDSLAAFAEVHASQQGKRALASLLDLESPLVDLAESPVYFGHDYPQFSRSLEPYLARPNSTMVKSYFPIRHRTDQTVAEAQRHWHTSHGSLVRWAAPVLDMYAYHQVHRVETPLEDELRAQRGIRIEPYLGHAETWQNRSIRPPAGPGYDDIRQRMIEDENRFIDFTRSTRVIGHEFLFVDSIF